MSLEISGRNEERLLAIAQSEGVSVDKYVELLINAHEEVSAIVERADARHAAFSAEETRAKIERGFLQSERGEVVDGDTFSAELLADLNGGKE